MLLKPLFWRSCGTADCPLPPLYTFSIFVSFVYLIFAILKPGPHVLLLNIRVSLHSVVLEFFFSELLTGFTPPKKDSMVKGSRVVCCRTYLSLYYALVKL